MTQCHAICKGYPYKACTFTAKYNDDDDGTCPLWCGIHRTNKPAPKNLCQGLTKEGKKCTHPVKRGQFCNIHLVPKQPDHDYSELKLYNPDINWPSMSSVLNCVKKVLVVKYILYLKDLMKSM
jgi:hypothetical protein